MTAVTSQANDFSTVQLDTKIVTMHIGDHKFGVMVKDVDDVIRRLPITIVPKSPPHVIGVMNLRGYIVTEIDFSYLLGIGADTTSCDYAVVVKHGDFMYSFVFEGAGDVLDIAAAQIEKIPDTASLSWKSLCLGVYRTEQDLLTIVDFNHLLTHLCLADGLS